MTTRSASVRPTGNAVIDRFEHLGFHRRRESDTHVLLVLGRIAFSVPRGEREVPAGVLRMYEAALAPLFGRGCLDASSDPIPDAPGDRDRNVVAGAHDIRVLDAVVLGSEDEGWRAFLPDLPGSAIGYGDDRIHALRDLKLAVALRSDTPPERILLVTAELD